MDIYSKILSVTHNDGYCKPHRKKASIPLGLYTTSFSEAYYENKQKGRCGNSVLQWKSHCVLIVVLQTEKRVEVDDSSPNIQEIENEVQWSVQKLFSFESYWKVRM